jgi:hypothetical protein
MTGLRIAPRQRRVTAWLCLAAMLLIAFAPALSRALDRPHCPPSIVHLAMASEELRHDAAQVAASGVLDHCGYCVLFGAPFGLIEPEPPVVAAVPAAERSAKAPASTVAVAGPRYSPAQPRAPPLAA